MSPEEVGQLVDKFKQVEASRLAADKIATELKAEEVALKLMLVQALKELKISAIGGHLFKVEHSVYNEPTVKDWTAFYDHIHDTHDFSLLERRPSKAAVKERWSDGKEVPGVEAFPVDKLSFTKLKG